MICWGLQREFWKQEWLQDTFLLPDAPFLMSTMQALKLLGFTSALSERSLRLFAEKRILSQFGHNYLSPCIWRMPASIFRSS